MEPLEITEVVSGELDAFLFTNAERLVTLPGRMWLLKEFFLHLANKLQIRADSFVLPDEAGWPRNRATIESLKQVVGSYLVQHMAHLTELPDSKTVFTALMLALGEALGVESVKRHPQHRKAS